MDSKTINRKIAKNTILTLMDNITQNSELPMLPAKLVNQFSSELQYKNNKYRILIGIKELFSYRDKNQVLEQNCCCKCLFSRKQTFTTTICISTIIV